MTNKVYIIAEAGVNHNGRLDIALRLCEAAKAAGADAVKFQTWKTEQIVTHSARLATYQENNISDKSKSQFQMLKELELSFEDFRIIKEHCDRIGIDFLSTPSIVECLDYLCDLQMPFIKLGSGEVTNIPFLRKVGTKRQNVILSTGMSYMSDIDIAYRTLMKAGALSVTILHCTTNYPCPYEEVNLNAMISLRQMFKCKVGYSDHTIGIEVPVAAVAMGAEIIEKHFTLDKNMDGPDHAASLNPDELKSMVNAIRNIEQALGDGVKKPNASEIDISRVVLKSIVAKRIIKKGEVLSDENLAVKRANAGIPVSQWDFVEGKLAVKDFDIDEPISL